MTIEEKINSLKKQQQKLASLEDETKKLVHEKVCQHLSSLVLTDPWNDGKPLRNRMGCLTDTHGFCICRKASERPEDGLSEIKKVLQTLKDQKQKKIKDLLKIISSLKE